MSATIQLGSMESKSGNTLVAAPSEQSILNTSNQVRDVQSFFSSDRSNWGWVQAIERRASKLTEAIVERLGTEQKNAIVTAKYVLRNDTVRLLITEPDFTFSIHLSYEKAPSAPYQKAAEALANAVSSYLKGLCNEAKFFGVPFSFGDLLLSSGILGEAVSLEPDRSREKSKWGGNTSLIERAKGMFGEFETVPFRYAINFETQA